VIRRIAITTIPTLARAIGAPVAPARADEPLPPPPDPAPQPQPQPAPLPPPPGAPQPPPPTADPIGAANSAAVAGNWTAVDQLLRPLMPPASLDRADEAEVYRLAGLAAFFLGRLDEAEARLLAYLRLDIDARLDPAVVPPEAITYFENIRAKHSGELRALRPKPRRYMALNLLPPAGQFQNGERTKGIIVGASLAALIAAHVTTYFVLRDWCNPDDLTCDSHAGAANTLRAINITSGVGAIVLYAYGVVDGIRHYRRRSAALRLEGTAGGAIMSVGGSF
jgi:hypothetical protein